MATTLFGAIEERFASSTALAQSVPGGLTTGKAQETPKEPYCVLVSVSSVPEFTTGNPYTENSVVQLNVFGEDGASVELAMRDIEKTFDFAALPLTGTNSVLAIRRTNTFGPDPPEDNPSTWMGILEFDVTLERTLA